MSRKVFFYLSALAIVMASVSHDTLASVTGTITVTGTEQVSSSGVWDTGTVTVTVNASYSRTVSYGQYSTAASIASALAAAFTLDCNGPVRAHANGAQITFKMRGSATSLTSLTISGTYNSAVFQTAAFPANTSAGSVGGTGWPLITSLLMTTGTVGSPITLTGINFGPSGTVTINGIPAPITSWSSISVTVTIPAGATSGLVVVNTFGMSSNGVPIQLISPVTCPI